MDLIIGISGKANSGKNYMATVLEEFYNKKNIKVIEYAFADNVKSIASILFNIPISNFYDRELKEEFAFKSKLTHREIMQKVGTSMRNEFGDEVWVKSVLDKIKSNSDINTIHVITDVRYKSEANAIKKKGGLLIRVTRPEEYNYDHDSETELDDYSFDKVVSTRDELISYLETI